MVTPWVFGGVSCFAGDQRRPVMLATGSVRNEVLTPFVKHVSPWIGKGVIRMNFGLMSFRVIAPDACLVAPSQTIGAFYLRLFKSSLAEIQSSTRSPFKGGDTVVGVCSAHADNLANPGVGNIVAISIFQEEDVRLLSDKNPSLA